MAFDRGRAAVVVLGDVGRSPRMQYHALSLANQAGLNVDVVGYSGNKPHESLLENPKIHFRLLSPSFINKLPKAFYLLTLPLKLILQIFWLLWILFKIPAPDIVFLQNPPTIPTFTILQFVCWMRRSKLVIDWHNFGYTLLGLRFRPSHPLVKLHEWYEKTFGVYADGHLCVSKAMQKELQEKWKINAKVLYDRPTNIFKTITVEDKHDLFFRLHKQVFSPLNIVKFTSESAVSEQETLFTVKLGQTSDSTVKLLPHRPALVVSSTSWTPDEDFEPLLEAAIIYDRRAALTQASEKKLSENEKSLPNLIIVITGKGPLRDAFEKRASKLNLSHVAICTVWLAAEDYPKLLAAADMGISFHSSSSGIDLPMKVVDMIGCGLPVASVRYACIDELINEGDNGLLFDDSFGLAKILEDVFRGFNFDRVGGNRSLLEGLRDGAVEKMNRQSRWDEEWEASVLPLMKKLCG